MNKSHLFFFEALMGPTQEDHIYILIIQSRTLLRMSAGMINKGRAGMTGVTKTVLGRAGWLPLSGSLSRVWFLSAALGIIFSGLQYIAEYPF